MTRVSKTTGDIGNNNKSDQNYYDNDTASEGDSDRDAKRANVLLSIWCRLDLN